MSNGQSRLTQILLACGVAGAFLFLIVFHIDAATRPGFDLLRHGPSLLMLSERGWIQIANFTVTGLLMIACSIGLRQTLYPGRASKWGPLLMAAYGLGMISTGIFVTDPQVGYPPGTPQDLLPGVNAVSTWHGDLHWMSVFFMYAMATAACFVLARRFAEEPGNRWWTASLVITGIAAPTVLFVGAVIVQTLAISNEGFALLDGIFGRAIIPLGWVWAGLVPLRLMMPRREPNDDEQGQALHAQKEAG